MPTYDRNPETGRPTDDADGLGSLNDPHHFAIPVITHWNAYSQDVSDVSRPMDRDHVASVNGKGK